MNTNTARNAFGFGKLLLTCVSSTQSENGGFINKLVHKSTKSIDTPFGKKTQPVQHTFYMKTDEAVPADTQAEMNLDEFRITERSFEVTDSTSELFGTELQLKWLHI